ncbi:hypothetical protein Q5P01_008017 [Channa striata]|uniref:Uncharacterized protein n=1 Tax=Channa striata TaxID=64152 RepID=A0AA88SWV6_CHASR|nr:hypothetical protein Q5P01_008017 [Channa striata]
MEEHHTPGSLPFIQMGMKKFKNHHTLQVEKLRNSVGGVQQEFRWENLLHPAVFNIKDQNITSSKINPKPDGLRKAHEVKQATRSPAMETETNEWACSFNTISTFTFSVDYNT